jgi:clan AA aspartic protease
MLKGSVNAYREAVLQVNLRGVNDLTVEFVVDTGFTGYLTLTPDQINSLGCSPIGRSSAILADGSEQIFTLYAVTTAWNGVPRTVEAYEIASTPLIGMSMLYGHHLHIHVVDGGEVALS